MTDHLPIAPSSDCDPPVEKLDRCDCTNQANKVGYENQVGYIADGRSAPNRVLGRKICCHGATVFFEGCERLECGLTHVATTS